RAKLIGAAGQPQPDHARKPAAPELSDVAEGHLKRWSSLRREPVGDSLDERPIDGADEPQRDVQVFGHGPPEVGSDGRARFEVTTQLQAMGFGERKSEERPDRWARAVRQRRFTRQLTGAHELGAEGRQPKCVVTESRPSATLGIWLLRISSGVMSGSSRRISITAAPGISSSGMTWNFGFLIPRAVRNQS